MALALGIAFIFKRAGRTGRLGSVTHFILTFFICFAVFRYQADMAFEVYLHFENLKITDLIGFWMAWIVVTLVLLALMLTSLKRVADFWALAAAMALSMAGYTALSSRCFFRALSPFSPTISPPWGPMP